MRSLTETLTDAEKHGHHRGARGAKACGLLFLATAGRISDASLLFVRGQTPACALI